LLLWKNRLSSSLINIGNETENGIGYGPDNPEYKAWQENEICLFPTTTFAQG